jgi:hypothetical protein
MRSTVTSRSNWAKLKSMLSVSRPIELVVLNCRNKASILLDKIANAEAGAIQRQMIEAAKSGDLKAAELILARIWPLRRGRPVRIELPSIQAGKGVSEAMVVVVDAMVIG